MEWERFARGGVQLALKRVVLWYGVMLLTGLTLAWMLGIRVRPEVVLAGAVFFYVDVFGVDGGAIYGIAKVVGGRASFERHLAFVSWWKPPILVLQTTGLLVNSTYSWGALLYYAFMVAELAMLWVTFRKVHRLSPWRSALLLALITAVMVPLFLTDGAVRGLTNVLT